MKLGRVNKNLHLFLTQHYMVVRSQLYAALALVRREGKGNV
jgi:hypothetical protein